MGKQGNINDHSLIMILYRLSWDEPSEKVNKTRQYIRYFEAEDNGAAGTETNNILPRVATNIKLYTLGEEIEIE